MADSKEKRIDVLYEALKKKNKYMAQLCGDKPPKDPLQRISNSYNNTFLHMAIRFKQKDLINEFLGMLPEEGNTPLSNIKNDEGNTILHEVACSDSMKDVAEKVLIRDRELLIARNNLGETPIFCAARYDQIGMFKFLEHEMKLKRQSPEDGKHHLRRNDGTTVLHISINTECFEFAHFIAERYEYLITERDKHSMTALQYLACNPSAFGRTKMKISQGFTEELFGPTDEKQNFIDMLREKRRGFMKELHRTIYLNPGSLLGLSKRHSLQGLVKLLVKQDTSGHVSINEGKIFQEKEGKNLEKQDTSGHVSINEEKIFQEKEGKKLEEKKGQNSTKLKKRDESPLFLATISNIQEIVEEILVCQPQMLENTNKEGMNILQVAILHRCIEIFDMVVKLEVLPSSLLSTTDKEGNSLLHMVGKEKNSQAGERMQTPAFQLQKELLLFQKVKSACKMHLINPLNNDDQTAEELFATSNEDLHKEAKNWLMRTTKNCTILSVFIATVAFAAAYTVPGGPDQKTGIPILNSKPFFVVFIVADVVSLAMALTSTGIFFSILTSSFPLQHFETYLFDKLRQGIICLIFSVSMMAVAFGATIVLLMKHNGVQVLWLAVGFLPVPIFFLSYSPLSSAVLKLVARNRCTESFKNFVAKFLKVVGIVVVLFPFVLFFLLSGAFYGLYWTVKKACEFIICKPVLWICEDKSQLESDTQSPQV